MSTYLVLDYVRGRKTRETSLCQSQVNRTEAIGMVLSHAARNTQIHIDDRWTLSEQAVCIWVLNLEGETW